jgi:ectoine hydroxylase-related dioxygenase (phytanoyl-CoA dioxygenase family)
MTTVAAGALQAELERPYKLSDDQIQAFQTNGYIKLKQVLTPEVLAHFGDEITNQVIRLNTLKKPMHLRSTYEKAFLQITNLWRQSEIVKQFVFSRRLARIAAELMGVRGVRLYHDQALYKEPSGGFTPWHADQYYWPLESHTTCTVWIPLQETPIEMGPLAFAIGSQTFEFGRDLVISDESEEKLQAALKEANFGLDEAPFDLGEVSYHYGWTYHRAGPNTSDRPRKVMTIIYMEDGNRVIQPKHKAHEADLRTWMPGTKVGEPAETELNPLLYRAQ